MLSQTKSLSIVDLFRVLLYVYWSDLIPSANVFVLLICLDHYKETVITHVYLWHDEQLLNILLIDLSIASSFPLFL